MQRRVLLGLALLACLLASGWAWQRLAEDRLATDIQGNYIRVTVTEGREALCTDTPESVPEGILRIGQSRVSTAVTDCAIARRRLSSEGAVELALICGDAPDGPDGFDALLTIAGPYADWTGYVALSGGEFAEAHATFQSCADLVGWGPPTALY